MTCRRPGAIGWSGALAMTALMVATWLTAAQPGRVGAPPRFVVDDADHAVAVAPPALRIVSQIGRAHV